MFACEWAWPARWPIRPILGLWGAKCPKMGDSLPWRPMNRRAKFDDASFILGGEIRNRANTLTGTDISTPCLSACVNNNGRYTDLVTTVLFVMWTRLKTSQCVRILHSCYDYGSVQGIHKLRHSSSIHIHAVRRMLSANIWDRQVRGTRGYKAV